MKRKPTTDLSETLRKLNLTTIVQHYEPLAEEAARDQIGHVEYLSRLADIESAARYERSVERRIKRARLPVLKTLEQFLWSWPTKINRPQIQDLFRLRFIEQNVNIVFMGNVGLGQTHLASALAAQLKRFSPALVLVMVGPANFFQSVGAASDRRDWGPLEHSRVLAVARSRHRGSTLRKLFAQECRLCLGLC